MKYALFAILFIGALTAKGQMTMQFGKSIISSRDTVIAFNGQEIARKDSTGWHVKDCSLAMDILLQQINRLNHLIVEMQQRKTASDTANFKVHLTTQ